jgi:hypothetical protein
MFVSVAIRRFKQQRLTPAELASTSRHENTERVDKEVIAMVFPENLDLTRVLPDRVTVQE